MKQSHQQQQQQHPAEQFYAICFIEIGLKITRLAASEVLLQIITI